MPAPAARQCCLPVAACAPDHAVQAVTSALLAVRAVAAFLFRCCGRAGGCQLALSCCTRWPGAAVVVSAAAGPAARQPTTCKPSSPGSLTTTATLASSNTCKHPPACMLHARVVCWLSRRACCPAPMPRCSDDVHVCMPADGTGMLHPTDTRLPAALEGTQTGSILTQRCVGNRRNVAAAEPLPPPCLPACLPQAAPVRWANKATHARSPAPIGQQRPGQLWAKRPRRSHLEKAPPI